MSPVPHPSTSRFFEANTKDWSAGADRVASGTGGITSASGDFHAESLNTSAFHCFGAGSSAASNATPSFTASLDVYLDVGGNLLSDTRFDYSVALSDAASAFLRDFVFNVGFYDDATGPGAKTNRYVVSASNNAGRSNASPKNPGRDPIAIDTTGRYTFQHAFFDDGGTLGALLSVFYSGNRSLGSWSLGTNPIASVGSERYRWIVNNEFSRLAFDNTSLSSTSAVPVPSALALLGGGLVLLRLLPSRKRRAVNARSAQLSLL